MEVKQRGNVLGHTLILFIYKIFGYSFVSFILNFVAIYYFFFTPSVRKNLFSYYEAIGIPLSNKNYFLHLKMFAFSILDRFISRIKPDEFTFCIYNSEVVDNLNKDGGILLLSHVGSWASAAHCLENELPHMNVVMKENTTKSIKKFEQTKQRKNESNVTIIDLSQGAIASNIQIANALMNNEVVAMMADRYVDEKQKIKVHFLGKEAYINKAPFEIAKRIKKPLTTIFVMNYSAKKYELKLQIVEAGTVEEMAQSYINILENIVKLYPNQWYNMYDFFKEVKN